MSGEKIREIINNLIIKLKNAIHHIPKPVKIIVPIVVILILIICLVFVWIRESQKQKYVEYNGKNLSESKYPGYEELIDALQEEHPNWTFTLFYTRLDWNEVIANEGHKDNTEYPTNLIPDSTKYPEDWRCEIDKDRTFDNGTWLCASDKAIKHQMDPRNILNNEKIFQFAELKYVEGAQTKEGINEITKGSFLEGDSISEALIEAGRKANLDSYFIASRLIQEQGRDGTTLSRGYEYNGTIAQMLFLESEDPDKEIFFYINSPGGSITDGMAIVDTMNYIKCPVSTMCVGLAASMGAVLLACGEKGKRFATPNSEILIHQPLIGGGGLAGQTTEIKIHADHMVKTREKLNKVLSERTGQTLEQIEKDTERDHYMTAEEALKYGLIDSILDKKV